MTDTEIKAATQTGLVFWRDRKITLRVIGTKLGNNGELRYEVCKAECQNPRMGQFSVRVEDVVAL